MVFHFSVPPEDDGLRLDLFLRRRAGLSSTLLRRIKRDGLELTVDGEPRYTNQPVRAGERVAVDIPDYAPSADSPAPDCAKPLKVLFEDDFLLAVWKPPMLQTHPSPSMPRWSDTLENRVLSYLGYPAHPVHRLDSETSGIVLFSKLPYIQWLLQQKLSGSAFEKGYLAAVCGAPSPSDGVIDAPIARIAPDSFTRCVSAEGRRALTRYRCLMTFPAGALEAPVSVVRLSPLTGRTHQLRVHLHSIGCPILGDARYATEASAALSSELGLARQQLCADRLCFVHPVTHAEIRLQAENDLEMLALLKKP